MSSSGLFSTVTLVLTNFFILFSFVIHGFLLEDNLIKEKNTTVLSVPVTVFSSGVAQTVSERFLSVTLDTALIRDYWLHLNLSSIKVLTLAKHLKPCYLRVGGSLQDFLYFEEMPAKLNYNHKKKPDLKPFNMTSSQLDELFNFASKVGWDVIFGLNMLNRSPVSWEPWDAIKILSYIRRKGHRLAGLELGNEPDVYNLILTQRPDPAVLGKDFQHLRSLMQMIPFLNNTLLLGPDVTNLPLNDKAYMEFFSRYLDAAHTALDAITIHQYYLNGATAKPEQFYDPQVMDILEKELLSAHRILRNHAPGKKIWLGETSAAWNSGAKKLSNSYIAGFLWLDKLGMAARYNVQVVLRQDFYGGSYGLIDYNTLDPNPDYWLSVLYKTLVGTKVLDVVAIEPKRYVRVYAHCTNRKRTDYPPGSVTVYAINVFPNKDVNLTFTEYSKEIVHVYELKPTNPMTIYSKSVALNDIPLKLQADHKLPKFIPKEQMTPITVKRLTFGFYVFPLAKAKACL